SPYVASFSSPCRVAAVRLGSALQAREFGLERREASTELFILLARLDRHLLDGLELLALDHVHLAQQALALGFHHGFKIAAHALCRTCRIGHELGKLVEKPAVGLGHGLPARCGGVRTAWHACSAYDDREDYYDDGGRGLQAVALSLPDAFSPAVFPLEVP